MPATEVKLQGIVSRMVNKATTLDDEGAVKKPAMLQIIIETEMNDFLRTKLPDISRLQKGKTVNIILEEACPTFFKDEETKAKAKVEVGD